jgi:hypothetical protein
MSAMIIPEPQKTAADSLCKFCSLPQTPFLLKNLIDTQAHARSMIRADDGR